MSPPQKNSSNLVQPFGMLALLYIQSEISDYLCLIETILIMEMETVYHMLESVPAMILSILTSHHRSKYFFFYSILTSHHRSK